MANLGEQLLNALTLAGLLFLVSAGLSLVFGILRVVNFAHGVFYMLGAYLGYTTVMLTGWFWPALVIVPPVVGAIGAIFESSTLRFIYRRPPIYQLLLTFGLALILEEALRILYGPTAKGIDPPAYLQGAFALGSLLYPRYRLFVIGLGLVVALAVWLFLRTTRAGLVIRAVAQNSEMADCLGADVARVRTLVFGAACALAGLGGVAAAPMTTMSERSASLRIAARTFDASRTSVSAPPPTCCRTNELRACSACARTARVIPGGTIWSATSVA